MLSNLMHCSPKNQDDRDTKKTGIKGLFSKNIYRGNDSKSYSIFDFIVRVCNDWMLQRYRK